MCLGNHPLPSLFIPSRSCNILMLLMGLVILCKPSNGPLFLKYLFIFALFTVQISQSFTYEFFEFETRRLFFFFALIPEQQLEFVSKSHPLFWLWFRTSFGSVISNCTWEHFEDNSFEKKIIFIFWRLAKYCLQGCRNCILRVLTKIFLEFERN